MVAPNKERWQVKWRDHCATCGVKFETPRRWAYCSKACEYGRKGFARRAAERRDEIDLDCELADEFLRISAAMESSPPHLREAMQARLDSIQETITVLNPEFAAPTADAPAAMIQPTPVDASLSESDPEFWLPAIAVEWNRFEATMRKGVLAAIRLGRRLNEAKAKLPHGAFGRLFADHEHPVRDALPFTIRWGQKLMVIAENTAISKAKHASLLPADLESVYHLSRVPAEKLHEAIERGAVRPAMGRQDARRAAADMIGSAPRPKLSDEVMFARCARAIRHQVEQLLDGRRRLAAPLARELRTIVRDLRTGRGGHRGR